MSFCTISVEYLDEYLRRMRKVVDALDPAHTWWRPHDKVLSIGNILLHLEGNVRQWILDGIAGGTHGRDRDSEFAASEGATATDMFVALEATVREACTVIADMTEEQLQKNHDIQGFTESGRMVVYHIVEHFSWHTGQMVWIAKARGGTDHGIAFFDDAALQ